MVESPRRHAELDSASIPETTAAAAKWALKRVQGDALNDEMLSYSAAPVLGGRVTKIEIGMTSENLATSVNIGTIRDGFTRVSRVNFHELPELR